mgnify:CR=1 FL=1
MKILITGAEGFVGKNLQAELLNKKYSDIISLCFDKETPLEKLEEFCKECDFVVHLAGVNRPKESKEFMEGNRDFLSLVLNFLEKNNNCVPFLITSSIQAALDNPYGLSKRAGEELVFAYGKRNKTKVYVYRLPNIFGKWCKPNYNSAIATFCYNITHDLPILVNDRNHEMNLVYIDDLIHEIISAFTNQEHRQGEYCYVPNVLQTNLGEIVDLLYSFKKFKNGLRVPNNDNLLEKYLYATFISYLPKESLIMPLTMHEDNRGSFTEIIRTLGQGQFSVNITHPGITKGNHFHHTKHEKYVVVSGKASIKLRQVGSNEIIEYITTGNKIEVVDIPCGYTHSITNIGDDELVTFMWANEPFDPNNPDTIALEVEQ